MFFCSFSSYFKFDMPPPPPKIIFQITRSLLLDNSYNVIWNSYCLFDIIIVENYFIMFSCYQIWGVFTAEDIINVLLKVLRNKSSCYKSINYISVLLYTSVTSSFSCKFQWYYKTNYDRAIIYLF